MQELFSKEFARENRNELYTVYKVEENLFQARSGDQIIILWKVKQVWEGASNQPGPELITQIGEAIDHHLQFSLSDKDIKPGI